MKKDSKVVQVIKLAEALGGHLEGVTFYGFTEQQARMFQAQIEMLSIEHRDLAHTYSGVAIPVCFPRPSC